MNVKMPTLSVIIPVFNEEDYLPRLIAYLQKYQTPDLLEIIVVDGQSTDNTLAVAENLDVQIVRSPIKGRAPQMNAGASVAQGELLYFLHADSFPPPNFVTAIQAAFAENYDAACFRLRFDVHSRCLQFWAWFTQFSATFLRFGDQSLFVSKSCFEKIGGYDEQLALLEDQDIVRRIKQRARFKVLPFYITTSSRKYAHNGYLRLQLLFILLYFLAKAGIPNRLLLRLYRRWVKEGKM